MPSTRTGTTEDRLRRLDGRGQRCDGQARHCTQTAIERYTLIAADPATGEVQQGAESYVRQTCSKHRRATSEVAGTHVLSMEPIPSSGARPQDVQRAYQRVNQMRQLEGRYFTARAGEPLRRIVRARFDVDTIRVFDQAGESFLLTEIFLARATVDPVFKSA